MSNEEKIKKEIAKALGINQKYIKCDINLSGEHRPYEIRNWFINDKSETYISISKIDSEIFLKYNLDFYNCIFNADIEPFNIEKQQNITNSVSFRDCEFNNKIKLTSNNTITIHFKELLFTSCKINNNINLIGIEIDSLEIYHVPKYYKNNSTFNKDISFDDCKFTNINIKDTTFNGNIEFHGCSSEEVNICKNIFHEQFIAKNLTIQSNFELTASEFYNSVNFSKSYFGKLCSFKKNKFISKNTILDFSEITFEDNAYFDVCKFGSLATFHMSSFKKTASFYKTKFKYMPNFSPGDFKGILNLNNTNLGFNIEFKKINEYSQKAYGANSIEQVQENIINFRDSFRGIKHSFLETNNFLEAQKYHKAELYCKEIELENEINNKINKRQQKHKQICSNYTYFANIITDYLTYFFIWASFTAFFTFISIILIIMILVSCYLFIKFNEYIINTPTLCIALIIIFGLFFNKIKIYMQSSKDCYYKRYLSKKITKRALDLTKWLDYATLHIYRNTSDHHTNFAKILNFTIGMISVFSIVSFILLKLDKLLIYSFDQYLAAYTMIIIISAILSLKLTFTNITTKVCDYFLVVILLTSSFITLSAISFASFMSNVAFSIFAYLTCVYMYYFAFSSKIITLVFFTKPLMYIIFIGTIIIKPALLNPLFGVFQNENLGSNNLETTFMFMKYDEKERLSNFMNDNNITINFNNKKEILNLSKINLENLINILKKSDENMELIKAIKSDISSQDIIRSISIIYTIIMLLCIYSLTKTARKNSIIQN